MERERRGTGPFRGAEFFFCGKKGGGSEGGGATGEVVLGGEKGEDELQPEQTDGHGSMRRRREEPVGGCDEGTLSVHAPISGNFYLLRHGMKGAEAVSFRLAGRR